MRSVKCVAHDGGRADVGIGPYEKAGSGSVGADFISAQGYRRVERTITERPPPPGATGRCHAPKLTLGRCVQHGLQENSIAPGGVVYQDMGDGSQ